jgi:hypothetical protein
MRSICSSNSPSFTDGHAFIHRPLHHHRAQSAAPPAPAASFPALRPAAFHPAAPSGTQPPAPCWTNLQRVVRFVAGPLPGAQDQPNRRVFAGLHPVLTGIVQVHVHLPGIGVAELANLEVDDQQALQAAVKEQAGRRGTSCRPAAAAAGGPRRRSRRPAPAGSRPGAGSARLPRSDSEYSSLRLRNSSTKGSLMACSGVMASPAFGHFGLFAAWPPCCCDRAMRS